MIHIIIGPPCAGKSQYVKSHAKDGDVVIDYDLIAKAMGSRVSHDATGSVRLVALAARWGAIRRILVGLDDDAWVIHTNPAPDLMQSYADAGAKFVLVDPGIDVCIARAKSGDRPNSTIAAIEAWYANPPAIPKPSKKQMSVVGNNKIVDSLFTAIESFIRKEVAKIPPAEPGKSVTLDDVRPVLAEMVAALPKPEDGKSVTLDDVRPLILEEVAKIPPAEDGADGVGLAGAVINRSGELVVTLTDGSQRELGPVVGKDGDPGAPGLGFDDMTEELADDGRTIVRRYTRGDQVKEFRHTMAVVLDKGVWRSGKYVKGDGVTLNGSFFIAQRDTSEKPETQEAKDDWRLSVKRGRDGKDLRPETPRESTPVKFR